VHFAAEVDARPAFLPSSRQKRDLIADCKHLCGKLGVMAGVQDASVFTAILRPPGRGGFIQKRRDSVHVARFDLAVLLECRSARDLAALEAQPAYRQLVACLTRGSTFLHQVKATNVRRIASVDHSRQGVFLFNYFFADRVEQNLDVWSYTAGWFQAETGLDNSTVLLPTDRAASKYSIINHCRWNTLGQILPSLLLKPSFRSYVLAHFEANQVAAMPILYRLA
jgi:hypothetical protein